MNKKELRESLKKMRLSLSEDRRKEASKALFHSLIHTLASYKLVLSFSSFNGEIDTTLLNHFLARTGRLALPRREEGGSLEVFVVKDLQDLILTPSGLPEPNPECCDRVKREEIEVALIPGLGFDQAGHRLGYGKGYYDRFLSSGGLCKTIGIGFKEQLVAALPFEKNDHPLVEITLF